MFGHTANSCNISPPPPNVAFCIWNEVILIQFDFISLTKGGETLRNKVESNSGLQARLVLWGLLGAVLNNDVASWRTHMVTNFEMLPRFLGCQRIESPLYPILLSEMKAQVTISKSELLNSVSLPFLSHKWVSVEREQREQRAERGY